MAERRRCAIYTRKSTEEGLDQAFNSLDAQREACSAYILSQAHEGWEQVPNFYDDGGWSGGSMERPALRQLLDDVAAGKVDIIVVYKVDRLTRSLADFAKIVEVLDAKGASFVSVTQAFNTTNSMGRLTLNVLLSFAQFEREVTGERIRDKIAASKQKGMWMGGPVPMGYDLIERKLVINEREAATIRLIFERYTALRSTVTLVEELDHHGVRTRKRQFKDGREVGGIPFTRGAITQLLKNPLYAGKVQHKRQLYPGAHDAIISPEQWDAVQAIFAANGVAQKNGVSFDNPSMLAGLLTDPDGKPMTPVHTRKGARRYRYYVTRAVRSRDQWRLPAGEIEQLAIDMLVEALDKKCRASDNESAAHMERAVQEHEALVQSLPSLSLTDKRALLHHHGAQVHIHEDAVSLQADDITVTRPATLARRGFELKLAVPPHTNNEHGSADPVLIKLVAQAFAAQDMILKGGHHPCVADYGKRHLWQLLRISWLAPDIIATILKGRQPATLTGRRLLRATNIPLDWQGQRDMFGFA